MTGEINSRRVRDAVRLIANVCNFIYADPTRANRVATLTLTVPYRSSGQEFHRHYNSLATDLLPKLFEVVVVRVSARQKQGRWHLHAVVLCHDDVKTGYVEGGLGKDKDMHNPSLQGLRRRLHRALPTYGFGWLFKLTPIKRAPHNLAYYLAQQLSPRHHAHDPRDKYVRRISYGIGARYWHGEFMLVTPWTRWWRQQVDDFARAEGCSDLDELRHMFGARWANEVRKYIDGCSIYGPQPQVPDFPAISEARDCLGIPTP